eukprot:10372941-Alexandrium_andersonii.AAC.1
MPCQAIVCPDSALGAGLSSAGSTCRHTDDRRPACICLGGDTGVIACVHACAIVRMHLGARPHMSV